MTNKYVQYIKNKYNKIPTPIFYLIAIAFAIRFIGIGYGLPLYINSDEPVLISTTVNLRHNINPERFDWPHLYYYINAVAYAIFYVIRSVISLFYRFEYLYSDSILFIISRFLSVIFGTLTIIPVYFFTKNLFNSKKTGLYAAMALTFLPIHANESHLAKLDIAQTFFIAVAFYFLPRILHSNRAKDYMYFGLFTGIATSIKYNGFLIFLPLLLAVYFNKPFIKYYLKLKNILIDIKNLFIAGITSVIAFYLGTPYALIDYEKFFSNERAVGAMWQFENVGKVDWIDYPAKLIEALFFMYRENLGLMLWIVFMATIIAYLFFNKRSIAYNLTVFPVLFFTFYICRFERSPDHYFLFLIPLYCGFLGMFMEETIQYIEKMISFKNTNYILTLLILSTSIYTSLKYSYLYLQKDTRNIAYDWVKQNINESTDSLYVYGDELEQITFQEKNSTRVPKIDKAHFRGFPLPYYVLIGVTGVSKESMLSGDRDPKNVEGDSEAILKYAEVKYTIDNTNRLGPPIYIFRVTEIRDK